MSPPTRPGMGQVIPFRPRASGTDPKRPSPPTGTSEALAFAVLHTQRKPVPEAGAVTRCERCGDPCKVAPTVDLSAKMLRKAQVPRGNYLPCAVAEWFVTKGLRESTDPSALLDPVGQEAFARVMDFLRADGQPSQIDWSHVVEHWALPFVVGHTAQGAPRRKHFPFYDPKAVVERQHRARDVPPRGCP